MLAKGWIPSYIIIIGRRDSPELESHRPKRRHQPNPKAEGDRKDPEASESNQRGKKMQDYFETIANVLRDAEAEVNDDYKNLFADRALQIEHYIEDLKCNREIDTAYATSFVEECEKTLRLVA